MQTQIRLNAPRKNAISDNEILFCRYGKEEHKIVRHE